MKKFFRSNDPMFRLLRTIVQGVIGVVIANIDLIISRITISPEFRPMIVALVMCVLSPVMAEIGKNEESE